MASEIDVGASLQAIPGRKERLQKALSDLENKRSSLLKRTYEWKDLEEHFAEVEKVLRKKFDEFKEKQKAFEVKKKAIQADLDKRDEVISSKEQASLSRVQEQKDAAIAAILEQKRKWSEERQSIENGAPLPDIEIAIGPQKSVDKEQQTPENAADASIAQSMDIDSMASKPAGEEKEEGAKNESERIGEAGINPAKVETDITPAKIETDISPAKIETDISLGNVETDVAPAKAEVQARPQLKSLCEDMDGPGLRKFLSGNKKDSSTLRAELPAALKCAIDPARVVLNALEGYHSSDPTPTQGDKKEAGTIANRRSCVLLLEALEEVLGSDNRVLPSNIKETAKQVSDQWKTKMNLSTDADAASGFSLDAHSFLQLVATFGLASEYEDSELCKIVISAARRKQLPGICRSLGLAAKIPDVIEMLIKDGKQIEALSFASEFSLLDRFQPVPLLKSYLKESRKSAQATLKGGNNSSAAQNDATNKELAALKVVLKHIDEYKLETQYPSINLQKRVAQLEKAKLERKRTSSAAKVSQAKKPRANDIAPIAFSGSVPSSDRPAYRPSDAVAPFGGVGVPSYGLGSQPGYDRPPHGGFGATFVGNIGSVSLPRPYIHPADGLGSSLYGSSAYTNPSSSYGGYQFGAALGRSAYQGPYLR